MLRNRQSFARQWGWLVVFGLLLTSLTGWAQTFPLQVQVSVLPPYSAYLQDYPGAGQQVRVFIINTSRSTYQIRLAGQLTGDNGIEIRTSANYRPPRPLTVPPGQTLLSRNDLEGLFDLNQVEVTGIDKNLLARGLPLPDGTYQLCIRAFNETATNTAAVLFGQPLSAEFPIGCSAPITVRSVEPPILIAPLCDAEVTATNPQAMIFTWTPPAGVSPVSVEYTLRVVELPQADVDPNVFIDAVALPRSGVEVRGLRTSTFLYGPTQPPLQLGKRYAWRVQAIDRSGKLHFLNDGKAPVCSFTYGTGLPSLAKTPGLELVQTPGKLIPLPGLVGEDTPPEGATAVASKISPQSTPYEQKITNCSCKTPPGVTVGSIDDNKTVVNKKQLTIAGFTVDLVSVNLDENQRINGSGTVQLPYVGGGYIKLRVKLDKVQCNSAGQAVAGIARGLLNQNAGLLPDYDKPDFSALSLKPNDVKKIAQKISDIKNDVLASKNSAGWEMPLGVYTSAVDVAITNVVFEPAQAYFDAVTWFKVAKASFGGLPLSATKVCLSPGKAMCGDMTLYLGLDTPVSPVLTFKGATTDVNNKAPGNPDFTKITNVNLKEWAFKSLHIVADLKLTGLKEASGENKDKDVAFTLVYDSPKADLNDWTARVSFPDFYVDKLSRDFIFSMDGQQGIYDQSESPDEAPDEHTAKLPGDYPQKGQKPGNEWTGLFFPKLKVTTTVLKSLNKGEPTTLTVDNLIYDDNGFTGLINATPIIKLGDGSLDGWYCSADTLRLNLFTSAFKEARLAGRVVMPIFKYTDEKQMENSSIWPYTCTLSKDEKPGSGLTYQFQIVAPKEESSVAIWAAKLSVLKGTNITVGNKGNKDGAFNATVTLNAKLSVNAKIVSPGMTIEGMELQSSPPDGKSYFKPGKMNSSFASPQKSLLADADNEGFPVTIKGVSLTTVTGSPGKYDFKFTGDITLMEGNVHAAVSPYVRFNIAFGAGKRPNWGLDKVGVDSVGIHGSLSFMRIDGSAVFFDAESNPKYGDGFKGDMRVAVLGAAMKLQGYFGRVGGFRYWQVGGLAELPKPIPIPGTPLSLAGFGGGAFHNMVKETQPGAPGKPSQIGYTPSKDHTGFEVAVEVTLQRRDLLDMTGVMAATVRTDNGFHLSDLRLDLTATLLGPEPDKALAKGDGYIDVNFDQGFFDSKFALTMSYQPAGTSALTITGKGDMGMHVTFPAALQNADAKLTANQSKPGDWYFYLGLPDATPCGNADDCFASSQRIKLEVKLSELGSVGFGSYFVMYNNLKPTGIDKLPPPPWGISEADLKALGYHGGQLAGSDALAFGAGFVADGHPSFGPFRADYHVALGFDFALQKVTAPCAGGEVPGINGWYANGQMYADMRLTLGIEIDVWIYTGYLELLKLQATALLEGGMVNPVWLHGSILLRYRALGGRIKGSTTFELWYNKDGQCKPAFEQPNPFADLPLISGMTPENGGNNVSVIAPYYAEFSYPVRTLIQINDVDPESKKPIASFRTFRLDFTSGTPANPFVTTSISSKSESTCTVNNDGRLRFGSDPDGGGNFNVSFFRDATLPPNTKLSVSLTLGVNLLNTGTNKYEPYSYKNQLITETKSSTFTTGECVSSLSQDGEVPSVAYSYPFEGQRYLTINDAGIFGYVELSSNFGCCLNNIQSDKFYRLSVRYTALKGGKFDKKDPSTVWTNPNAQFDGKMLRFGIPLNFLQKKTLYRLEVFREPTDALVAEQTKIIAAQKGKIRKALEANYFGGQSAEFGFGTATVSTKPGAGLGSKSASINGLAQSYNGAYVDQAIQQTTGSKQGTVTGIKVTGQQAGAMNDIKLGKGKSDEVVDVKTQLEQPVYSYYFQTSQYGTLAEKLKASPFLMAEQKTVRTSTIEAYTIPMQGAEGFDSYELLWKKLPNGSYLPPLVLQKVLDTSNPWFAEFVKPMLGLIDGISAYKNASQDILFKTAANTSYGAVDYETLMRQVVLVNQGGFDKPQPPLSKSSMNAYLKN